MKLPPAIILAGGLGTRLRSVVSDRPKPLALVAGYPFLHHLLTWLARQGIRDVVLCVGYRGRTIKQHLGTGKQYGLRIHYTLEKTLLGTGGAFRKGLRATRGRDAFILNGDSFVNVPLKKLFSVHRARHALLTMTVLHQQKGTRYGGVVRDRYGWMTRYAEKGHTKTAHMNAGVYCVSREILASLPRKKIWSLEYDFFATQRAKKIFTYHHKKPIFIDIGTPSDYHKSQLLFQRFSAVRPSKR